MLLDGMIEAAAVTQLGGEWPWSPRPQLSDDPEEVIRSGCPKYALSANVNLLWDITRLGYKRVAFVGLPCQVEAIALIKMNADYVAPELREAVAAIVCTVGIWCGNNFVKLELEIY
jgi:coenzyme F420 hydrogenase subunit beta